MGYIGLTIAMIAVAGIVYVSYRDRPSDSKGINEKLRELIAAVRRK